jgi:hypothetical protein
MERQLFEDLVESLRQAASFARASKRKLRTHRRVDERSRKERQALQMTGPRACKEKRLRSKRLRETPSRGAMRRKVISW